MQFPPPLSAEEERAAFVQMFAGSKEARDRIILSVMPFVIKQAMSSRAFHCEKEELISEGALRVCKAIDNFDPSKGFRFLSYLGTVLHNQHTKLGTKAATEAAKRVDDPDEVAINDYYRETYEEDMHQIGDVAELFTLLTYQEQYILIRRFGLFGYAQELVYVTAEKIGVSRSTINEMANVAISRLRRLINNDLS